MKTSLKLHTAARLYFALKAVVPGEKYVSCKKMYVLGISFALLKVMGLILHIFIIFYKVQPSNIFSRKILKAL